MRRCHAYRPSIHDQSHLSGLVDVTSEGDAGAGPPLAAVVRSALKGWRNIGDHGHLSEFGVRLSVLVSGSGDAVHGQ